MTVQRPELHRDGRLCTAYRKLSEKCPSLPRDLIAVAVSVQLHVTYRRVDRAIADGDMRLISVIKEGDDRP